MAMEKQQRDLWKTFTQTGQISDYLRYHDAARREREPNPRRKIADSSKGKEFY